MDTFPRPFDEGVLGRGTRTVTWLFPRSGEGPRPRRFGHAGDVRPISAIAAAAATPPRISERTVQRPN